MLHFNVLHDHLHAPDAEALQAFLLTHLRAGTCLLQVIGEGEVFYAGRATSTADAGDYLVLIKPDGSLQVHGPKGVKPLNWQPRTDHLHVEIADGHTVLAAQRKNPDELLRIVFLEVTLAQAFVLRDDASFVLNGTEEQMRRALRQHPDLLEPGLRIIDEELPISVGGVDLYASDTQGRFVVVELKRAKATQEAVHQLQRYVLAVRESVPVKVRGILAAPAITNPAMAQLTKLGLEFVRLTALPDSEFPDPQPPLF